MVGAIKSESKHQTKVRVRSGEKGYSRAYSKRSDKSNTTSEIYFADIKAKAVFAANGTKPQFLIDTPKFKALVVGLEVGLQIPVHPGDVAIYLFLEGTGLMTVGDEVFEIKPGLTIVVPNGVKRGMTAKTRIIFLGSKGG